MGCSNNNQGHGHGHGGCGGHGNTGGSNTIPNGCCNATTGCNDWDGTLRKVIAEPIYVQKVYDAALFNLQHLINGMGVTLTPTPAIPTGARITEVGEIRCRKYFNPSGATPENNLTINPTTELSGAQFVRETVGGDPVTVVGPDGRESQKLIYVDTDRCDDKGYGTSIYGTQIISVSGSLEIEIDVKIREACGRRCNTTLKGLVDVSPAGTPAVIMNNFFELCVPSTSSGAFFPRFAELCNISCQTRVATGQIDRDFTIEPKGTVTANIVTALCLTCEKKIIVPVQLCVLSTGFPELSPETSSVCNSYPSLFPNQIDKESVRECLRDKKDDDCHKPSKPGNSPRYQGLSLSEDDEDDEGEI